MKIIIKENQLQKIAFKYLESQFEPHEVLDNENSPNMGEFHRLGYVYWVKNDILVAEFLDKPKEGVITILRINGVIGETIYNMFSLTEEQMGDLIETFFKTRYGLKDIDYKGYISFMAQDIYDGYD